MSFGLTATGFVKKRLEDIRDEIIADLTALWGEINTDPDSVTGQLIGIAAEREANVWERMEEIYLAQYPAGAEGFSLDGVAQLTGVTRLAATHSEVIAALIGTLGTIVPAGTQAKVADSSEIFASVTDVTISSSDAIRAEVEVLTSAVTTFTITINGVAHSYNNSGGNPPATVATQLKTAIDAGSQPVTVTRVDALLTIVADDGETAFSISVSDPVVNLELDNVGTPVGFQAVNTGLVLAPVGDLNVIVTPVSGLDAVENLVAATVGRDVETDVELRIRRAELLQMGGAGTVDAIRAHLLQDVENVTAALVYDNRTDVTEAVIISLDAALITGNVFGAKVNGVALAGAGLTFATDNDTTMQAIAAIFEALTEVASAEASDVGAVGYYNTITVKADLLEDQTIVVTEEAVTGGATQPTVTSATGGLPPHSINAIVQGGADADICQTIWDYKPGGIYTHGAESALITDSQGFDQRVRFDRAEAVNVRVDVFITRNTEQAFPTDGLTAIETAILAVAEDFTIGEDIMPQRLFAAIFSVAGVATAEITWELGSGAGSPPYGNDAMDKIVIDVNEVATLSAAQVTVRE